ncbi:MAG: holo-ACP synthase [Bacteroidota bacterium]
MMVKGIGVDIIEIERVRESIARTGGHFVEKVFTDGEVAYCSGKQDAAQHFAARFAAKEAVSKALATGWSGAFRWKDVEVTNDALGRPEVRLHGKLKDQLGKATVFLSLSHSLTHVVAMAVIEDRAPCD